MRKTAPTSTKPQEADEPLYARDLPRHRDTWLMVCDMNRNSERTIEARRDLLNKLIWFLSKRELEVCDLMALRQFLHYASAGHKDEGGRWGNPRMTNPTKPGTIKDYHAILRTFFGWLVTEFVLSASPMARIPVPTERADQVQPFTLEHVKALLNAAHKSSHPRRDEAILLLMFDTGLRASEVCGLDCGDIDLQNGQCLVRSGKGGKSRLAPFSHDVKRALFGHLNERAGEPGTPLFVSDRGIRSGERLTRSGLAQLFRRLGKAARIEGVRCSPHTMRHSFAIEFLRSGGSGFTLKELLGHTDLGMTNRYVALAQADITNQHRQYSPVSRLKGGRRK